MVSDTASQPRFEVDDSGLVIVGCAEDFDDRLYDTNAYICGVLAMLGGQGVDELYQQGYLSGPGRIPVSVFKDVFNIDFHPDETEGDYVKGMVASGLILHGIVLNGMHRRFSQELGYMDYTPFDGAVEGIKCREEELIEHMGVKVVTSIVTARAPIPAYQEEVERLAKEHWVDVINHRDVVLLGNPDDPHPFIGPKPPHVVNEGYVSLGDDGGNNLVGLPDSVLAIKHGDADWQQCDPDNLPDNTHFMTDWSPNSVRDMISVTGNHLQQTVLAA